MNRKLNKTLFAVALVSTGAVSSAALAEVQPASPAVNKIFAASMNDPARVTGTGMDAKLRKTDEEFTNEQATFAIGAGNKGIAVQMMSSQALNPFANPPAVTLPPGNGQRMQGACAPIELAKSAAGPTEARAVPGTQPLFVTNNNGNEYRNFNFPAAYAINGGKNFVVLYNAQLNSNDTKRYAMVVDAQCNTIPVTGGQTGQPAPTRNNPGAVVMAKNNDDCAQAQDGGGETIVSSVGGKTKVIGWAGCNGNGGDDGHFYRFYVDCQLNADGAATSCAVKKGQGDDVVLAQAEERTRGKCVLTSATDNGFAACAWTEGNNQNPRDGSWIGGVDMTDGQAVKVLWKKMIEGRKDLQLGTQNVRTYSQRATINEVLDANGKPTDVVMFRTGDVRGNNQNNQKGGTYMTNQMSLFKVTRTDKAVPVQAPTNYANQLLGLDGTHLVTCTGRFGTKNAPGIAMIAGSMTAKGDARVRFVTTDGTKLEVQKQSLSIGANYDIHLYANYLGNNPGNQGRGFAKCEVMADPFNAGQSILITAVNGKDKNEPLSSIKPSGFMTVLTVAGPAAPAVGGGAGQSGSGNGAAGGDGDSSVAGCSTGSGSTGLASLLLLGLVALFRRRRA